MDKLLDKLGAGWKTTLGGVLAILTGAVGLGVKLIAPETEVAKSIDAMTCLGLITGGLAALGIGHKAERTRRDAAALVKEVKPENPGG